MSTAPNVMHRLILGLWLALAVGGSASAGPRDHVFPISLSFGVPSGSAATAVDATPGIGLSLGYAYAIDRQIGIGALGTWMRTGVRAVPDNDLSTYQLMASVRYRLFKHDWTPYVQVEGGLALTESLTQATLAPPQPSAATLLPDLGSVTAAYGARLGVYIPMGDRFDIDVHGRWSHTDLNGGLQHIALHVGLVYAPQL
jgi:hypothetical protein